MASASIMKNRQFLCFGTGSFICQGHLDEEAAKQGYGKGIFVEAEVLWRNKLEAEANSEAFDFLRSRKRKHFA